jgi:hypothetical protein
MQSGVPSFEDKMGEGNRRNDPCHCGSGKKYENCCYQKDQEPRLHGSTFEVTEDTVVTGIAFRPSGSMRLMSGDRPVGVTNTKSAEWRKTAISGLALKSQIDLPECDMFVDPEAILAGADYVFGVDTNQSDIHGTLYNIACLTCATKQIKKDGFDGSIQQIQAVDFQDRGYPAERIGWLFAIEAAQRSGRGSFASVILCTDHDVRAHTDINRRLQPIIEDYLLPPNFRLMYARDKGSSIPNKVIAAAHKGAIAVRRRIEASPPAQPQLILPDLLGAVPRGDLRIWHSDAYRKFFDPDVP